MRVLVEWSTTIEERHCAVVELDAGQVDDMRRELGKGWPLKVAINETVDLDKLLARVEGDPTQRDVGGREIVAAEELT